MITLALDDGADETPIRERVTHAKPVKNAFDHYYRGTKWLRTCEEISSSRSRAVGLPRSWRFQSPRESHSALLQVCYEAAKRADWLTNLEREKGFEPSDVV